MQYGLWNHPRRAIGACAGLALLAVVPVSAFGAASAVPVETVPSPGASSGPNGAIVPGANGSATWTGTGWIVVDQPAGSEVMPEPPLELHYDSQLDADYAKWEAEQAKRAETLLVRRLAYDDYSQRRIQLRTEYLKWESIRANEAHERLEHRLQLAAEAADSLALANAHAEAAQSIAAHASGSEKAQADLAVAEAAAALENATKAFEDAQDVAVRYRERALSEANHLRNAQTSAVWDLAAERDNAMARGMGVKLYDEPVEMVVVEYLNARRGPGVGYEKVGEVYPGTKVLVTGRGQGFYRLHDGSFLAADYVVNPDEVPDNLNLLDTGGFGGGFGGAGYGISVVGTPVDPPSKFAFQSYVANVDSQEAVDACTGGLTYSPEISNILGKSYYPIHNYCGGMPILELKNGDLVNVQDVGVFKVVEARDVTRGDTTSVLAGIKGQILLQTCYPNSTKMRVVGLQPA